MTLVLAAGKEIFKLRKFGIDRFVLTTRLSRKFIPLDSPYYQGNHGIMVMFDCTDRKSFTEVPLHFNQIEQLFAAKTTQKMLVATKIDLADQRKISFEEAKQLADNLGVPYIETSAKHNINVTEAVNMLVRNVEIVAETNFRMLVHEVQKEIEKLPALLDETPTPRNWTPRCTIL